jgi:hypothetical protein
LSVFAPSPSFLRSNTNKTRTAQRAPSWTTSISPPYRSNDYINKATIKIERANMKSLIRSLTFATALTGVVLNAFGAEMEIKKPTLDAQGRFYLYRNADALLPYIPCDWMPGEASKLMKVDIACTNAPPLDSGSKPASGETCISVSIKWGFPNWCGVAFVSGPDSPPWWGEDERGWAYDLSTLKHRRLVFYGRSEQGASIQVKVGVLGDKPHGDSLKFPAETRWEKLTKTWTRFELDLSKYKPEQLSRICNGFTFVTNRDRQEGSPDSTEFQLSNIYFE